MNFAAAMKVKLESLPAGSIIVLHACCHNPHRRRPLRCPVERSRRRRARPRALPRHGLPGFRRRHRGGRGRDPRLYRIRPAVLRLELLLKSFSLYGERVGALSIVTSGKDPKRPASCPRSNASSAPLLNPPIHGGAVVAGGAELGRVAPDVGRRTCRHARSHPRHAQRPGREARQPRRRAGLSFIGKQRGMFSHTGLWRNRSNG